MAKTLARQFSAAVETLHGRSGGTRPCLQEDDGEAQGHTKSARSVAVRLIGAFQAVVLLVEGLCRDLS